MTYLPRNAMLLLVLMAGAGTGRRVLAQADTLTAADTVHLDKRQRLFSPIRQYSYHYAGNLADVQLVPLLRTTPDSAVQALLRRSGWMRRIHGGMTATGSVLLLAGLVTPRYRLQSGLPILTAGVGLFYGALIPLGQARRGLQRAVASHNQFIRSRSDDYYYRPRFGQLPQEPTLTLADTVAVGRRGLGYQYHYRRVRLLPTRQLVRLADRLADRDVKAGFQYHRRVSTLGGIVGGFGSTFLTTTLLSYGIRRANGSYATLNTPLFWGSLAALSFSYGVQLHVGRIQLRTVRLLNERLRGSLRAAAVGEHFPSR